MKSLGFLNITFDGLWTGSYITKYMAIGVTLLFSAKQSPFFVKMVCRKSRQHKKE